MIRTVPFANALAAVVLVLHLLGGLLAAAVPGAYLTLIGSWLFLDLSRLTAGGVSATLSSVAVGLVTVAVVAWVSGAALALVYNALAGEREARA